MKNAYLISESLLLCTVVLAVSVSSRSFNNGVGSFAANHLYSKAISQGMTKSKQQIRRVREHSYVEECSNNQDLVSVGTKPSSEELRDFCTKHCDGVYSLGCISEYVTCSATIAYVMSCPESLVLDFASEECVERDQVEVCKKPFESAVPFDSDFGDIATDFLSQNFSCLGLSNSFKSIGCSAICIACVFDVPVLYAKCPGSLKFDFTSQTCQMAAQVEECTTQGEITTTAMEEISTAEIVLNDLGSGSVESELLGLGTEAPLMKLTEGPVAFGELESREPTAFGVSKSKESAEQLSWPSTESAEEAASHKMIAFSCKGKNDGLYGKTCAVDIAGCFGQHTVLMRCPEGFFFDNASRICMEKNAMPACGGEYAIASGIGNLSLEIDQKALETVAFGSAIHEANIPDNTCDGLQDGIYGERCSNQSFVCVSEIPILLIACPSMKFDLNSATCLPEPQVSGCSGINTTDSEVPSLIQAASAFTQPQLAEAVLPDKISEVNQSPTQSKQLIFSCTGLPDGNYGDMCAEEFHVCVEGNAALLRCPYNFVYDAEARYCASLETMPQCSIDEQQAFGVETSEEETEEVVTTENPGAQTTSNPLGIETLCEFLPDGTYGQGCSTQFTACVAGSPIPMVCPAELKYDEESVKCLTAVEVAACKGHEVESMVSKDGKSVLAENYPPVVQFSDGVKPLSCNDKADGIYGEGCSNEFYACVAGVPIPMRCPGMEKFDEFKKQCLGGAHVPACGGEDATMNSSAVSTGSGNPLSTLSPSSPDFSCMAIPNGIYVDKCSAEVTVCLSGKMVKYQCPEPLKYDVQTMMCLPQARVAGCQDASVTEESAVAFINSKQPVPPARTPDFTCAGKSDGVYAKGCASEFIMCTSGLATYYRCPSPLKYDSEAEMCRDAELISACSNRSTTTALSTGVPLSSSTVNCSSQPDGLISSGCLSIFQYCIDGVLKQYVCPKDLKFDNVTQKCLAEPLVMACSSFERTTEFGNEAQNGTETVGKPQEAVVLPIVYLTAKVEQSRPITETTTVNEDVVLDTDPEKKTESSSLVDGVVGKGAVNCKGKQNGAYSDDCASEFHICINETILYLHCRSPLKFDRQSNQCVNAERLVECKGQQASSAVEMEQIAYGLEQGQTATPCEGREDGLFVKGCSSDFFACIDEQVIQMRCPGLQKFDAASEQCLPQKYVEACGAANEAIEALSQGSSAFEVTAIQEGTNQLYSVDSPSSKTRLTKQILDLFPFAPFVTSCVGLPDGKYSRGCSAEFILCIAGETKLDKCPSSLLKFDSSSQQCLPAGFVKECGSEINSTETPVLLLNQVASGVSSEEETLGFTCEDRPDGKYSQGCSPVIIQCESGEKKLLRCPGSLIFDDKTQQCRSACDVSACTEETGSDEMTQKVLFGAPIRNTTLSEPKIIEKPLLTMSTCFGKPDGTFADGCTSAFFMCIAGKETFYECPNDLKFDAVSEKCLPKTLVPACGGPVPEGPSFGKENSVGGPKVVQVANIGSAVPRPHVFECSKLPDGIYTHGCSPEFTLCVAGLPMLYRCPDQFMFDAGSEKCLIQSLVGSCTQTSIDKVTGNVLITENNTKVSTEEIMDFSTEGEAITFSIQNGTNSVSIPVAYSVTSLENLDPTLYFCMGKSDGLYIDGCTSDFFVCVEQTTLALHCTNSLKYDEISGLCLDESEVTVCNADTNSVVAFGASNELIKTTKASVPNMVQNFGSGIENMDLSAYCSGRWDGLYTEGCSSQFVSCLHGHGTAYDCPENLKFDVTSGICAPQDLVAACQEGVEDFHEPTSQLQDPAGGVFESVGRAFNFNLQ